MQPLSKQRMAFYKGVDTMPDNTNMQNETAKLFNQPNRSTEQILSDIDRKFEWFLKNGGNISASNANNIYGKSSSTHYQDIRRSRWGSSASRDFSDELKKALKENLFDNDFKKSLQSVRDTLAKELGVELGDLPKSLGQLAGKELAKRIKTSKFGKEITESLNKTASNLGRDIKNAYDRGAKKVYNSWSQEKFNKYRGKAAMSANNTPDWGEMKDVAVSVQEGKAANVAETLTETAMSAEGAEVALGGLTEIAGMFGPELLIAAGAVELVSSMIEKKLKAALEDFNKMLKTSSEAMGRYDTSRKKNVDLAQQRLEADVRTMVETPFKILEDAAQRWYDTWDSTLRTISATQGYTTDQVAYLYGAFVDRLKAEGLTSVIGANEIVNNLSSTLSKGLQGAAAEEFAYVATKLNALIPTQDFLNYADTYASVAMAAINQGKSQEEALQIANKELETFANSLLVAGQEISGGFTTGLQNASDLFQKAEYIAQTGKYGTGSQLGSTLTAISAITGAVAPDLAQTLIDAIYRAATGGNASELVALRSLAGINASNTQFLQALVQNPQEVFANIFDKLSTYQNMANGAYMEVAEGLSGIFGLSMDTFARVDFSQVANAVRESTETSSALDSSMRLLSSGQTTTNAELMRIKEVNKFMADEGLSYVLNNEAGRAVQQHMWEEEIARQLMETTYAVELKGDANKFLEALKNTTNGIFKAVLFPVGIADAVGKLKVTSQQDDLLMADLENILQLGQVGGGNSKALSNLTAYNRKKNGEYIDEQIVPTLVQMFGGESQFGASLDTLHALEAIYGSDILAPTGVYGEFGTWAKTEAANIRNRKSPINRSAYNWGTVGKSTLNALYSDYAVKSYGSNSTVVETVAAATEQAQSQLTTNFQKMLDSMEAFYTEDTSRSYSDFVATARQFGIDDYSKALEESGITEEAVRGKYEALQTQTSVKQKAERDKTEESFWSDSLLHFTKTNAWLESINATATNIYNIFDKYLSEWEDYFIKHTVYNSAYTRDTVQKVLDAEKDSSETAIYALADALTQNDVSLLVDPTMQTNALLAQILKVANAILTQNSNGIGGLSLPDTIAGLSLGIVNNT